jgi:hypothetical protein
MDKICTSDSPGVVTVTAAGRLCGSGGEYLKQLIGHLR